MPTKEDVFEFLAKEFGTPSAFITPEATLDEIGADSLGVVELPMKLEEALNLISVDGQDWKLKKTTVSEVVNAVLAAKPVPKLDDDKITEIA